MVEPVFLQQIIGERGSTSHQHVPQVSPEIIFQSRTSRFFLRFSRWDFHCLSLTRN